MQPIYISISIWQGTGDKAQAKKSTKKAQAKAQATRSEKLLASSEGRDFARNNFVLLYFRIVLNYRKTLVLIELINKIIY